MPSRTSSKIFTIAFGFLLFLSCASVTLAQEDEDFGEDAPDPIKLFRQGQKAHAKGLEEKSNEDLATAVEFYERALKLNPEFAEAEYHRAVVLALLGRVPDAEQGLRRAMQLKPDWSPPTAALAEILMRQPGRERDAEVAIRRAIELDSSNASLIYVLAELRRRAGDSQEALELLYKATSDETATAAMWAARGDMEKAAGDSASALKSLTRAIRLDPAHTLARFRRAEIYVEEKNFARALADLQAVEAAAKSDPNLVLAVASLYARADDKASAQRVLDSLPDDAQGSPEAATLRASLEAVNCENTAESREALERMLMTEPENASLLACLGELYRTIEPQRSLAYFKRAVELEPSNVKFATGYAAALLQLRKFPEAATILRRILQVAPEDYVARANYATALYELKLYKDAIAEYKWMSKARPDLAVIHFLIGSAHDHLGEYEDALRSYEMFLARADAAANQLEIDKVNLRLPTLRNQIKRGESVRKKGAR